MEKNSWTKPELRTLGVTRTLGGVEAQFTENDWCRGGAPDNRS